MEDVSFREASERLCGISSPGLGPRSLRARPKVRAKPDKPRLRVVRTDDEVGVIAAAADTYANHLLTNEPAVAYMAGRGFQIDVLRRYKVGFAAGGELIPYLRWRHLPIGPALSLGLVNRGGRESLEGRIVFPEVRHGRRVWMIGRLLEGQPSGARPRGWERGPIVARFCNEPRDVTTERSDRPIMHGPEYNSLGPGWLGRAGTGQMSSTHLK